MFSSCSGDITQTEKVTYPDITLKGTKYLLGRSDGDGVLFNADKMELYLNRKKAFIEGASFEQRKTATKELFVSGSADKADINTDTYLSELTGNVKIFLHEDGNSIEADSVSWNKDTESIVSVGNVYLDYGDIKIKGINLSGNLQTGVFTFKEITSGTITEKPKDQSSNDAVNSTNETNANSSSTDNTTNSTTVSDNTASSGVSDTVGSTPTTPDETLINTEDEEFNEE